MALVKTHGEAYSLPVQAFMINRILLPLLMLLHILFISSIYVVEALPAKDSFTEVYIFSICVFVYMASFFKLGGAKYLAAVVYAMLLYRTSISLIPSFQAADYLFFSTSLLTTIIITTISFNLLKDNSTPLPDRTVHKISILVWVLAITTLSFSASLMIRKAVNIYTTPYMITFALSFALTPFMAKPNKRLCLLQATALCILAIPSVLSVFTLHEGLFVRTVVLGSLGMILLALLSLAASWRSLQQNAPRGFVG